ncbi:MAG: cobalamin-binding protein [Planctomycetaceae bacterium]
MPPRHRIVSLLPSATEIVAALGMLDQLVGRSHECDYPPDVQRLPIVSRPRIDITKSGAEIDRQVKDSLRTGLSVYDVDTELLRGLRPDVILTQTQCDACAVTPQDLEAALTQSDCNPSIIDLRPQQLEQFFSDIHMVAIALHAADRGHELVVQLRGGFESLRHQASKLRRRPTIVCLEWFEPLMVAGNWIPELVELTGGVSLGATVGQHSPWFDWQKLLEVDPECLVLMPCGWDIERGRAESVALTSHPRWSQLAAVRAGKVFVADGNQFFNRPGPRLLESAQILAEILHPEAFNFGHRGQSWEKL